jgi:hypothetical protein
MLKKVFFSVLTIILEHKGVASILMVILAFGVSNKVSAQDDLSFYTEDPVLATELDPLIYGDGSYENLNIDFTVSNTLTFNKAHITLKETATSSVIFKKNYSVSDLENESLILALDAGIVLGDLSNEFGSLVSIIVEKYNGSIGASITKTLNP